MDMGELKSFSGDDDGERLNALLGKAGGKLLEVSNKTLEVGRIAAQKAVEGGKMLADKSQEKVEELRTNQAQLAESAGQEKTPCSQCGAEINAEAAFCSTCGAKVAV